MNENFYEILSYSALSPFFKKDAGRVNLKGKEKVLDFGCGTGAFSRFMAKELLEKSGSLTCYDISIPAIESAKRKLKRYKNIDFLAGDFKKLDIEKQIFDVILLHLVIYHIEKRSRQAIVNELAYLLKEKGRIFIFNFLFTKNNKNSGECLTREDIVKIMENAGLKEKKYEIAKYLFLIPTYIGEFIKT